MSNRSKRPLTVGPEDFKRAANAGLGPMLRGGAITPDKLPAGLIEADRIQVENLRAEVSALRAEVADLRKLVESTPRHR